jgi:hypothetical protein
VKFNRSIFIRSFVLISLIASLTGLSTRLQADTGSCGGVTITLPFNDVMASPFFCQIAAAYYSGLTNGTTATTYSPTQAVTREQMAAFTTRTLDQSLKRGNRRAALNQWWTSKPNIGSNLGVTTIPGFPRQVISDGTDLWISNVTNEVVRIRASDGKLLESWTTPTQTTGVLAALGRIFLTAPLGDSGRLYMIDPSQPAGAVTTVASNLGKGALAIAFDGARIWTANTYSGPGQEGSVSIITPGATLPWSVTTITQGFGAPVGIIFDGNNMWVVDNEGSLLKKLDANGGVIQQVSIPGPGGPNNPAFDGTNLWVPHGIGAPPYKIAVIRAATGEVIATLTGNGLDEPTCIAFDGERMLVTNQEGDTVSLWKASDLTPLGNFLTGVNSSPSYACSDGINFWITLANTDKLVRF